MIMVGFLLKNFNYNTEVISLYISISLLCFLMPTLHGELSLSSAAKLKCYKQNFNSYNLILCYKLSYFI